MQRSIYDEVVQRLRDRAAGIRIGDPAETSTEMGPIATEAQLETIDRMVTQAKADGAKLVYGGERITDRAGWYYSPTILACDSHQMPIVQEEVFGPVLAVIPFDDEAEALRLANDTEFGLAAGIWTQNLGRAHRLARDVRSGILWVNTYRAVSAMAPIGGFGASGYGRECGIDAVRDYTDLKTLWINLSTDPMPDPFIMR